MADRETVRLLARLGERVFIPLFLHPTRTKFPDYAVNPIEALKLFLSAYSFERQGSAPFYKELSVEALEKLSKEPLCSASFSRNLWEKFDKLVQARDGKSNRKVNPLWPGHGEDHRRDVVAVTCSEELVRDDHNLYRFASRSLKSDELRYAWDVLQRIRGIGPKIASLFCGMSRWIKRCRRDSPGSRVASTDRHLAPTNCVAARRAARRLKNDDEARKEAIQLAMKADCCALLLNAGS